MHVDAGKKAEKSTSKAASKVKGEKTAKLADKRTTPGVKKNTDGAIITTAQESNKDAVIIDEIEALLALKQQQLLESATAAVKRRRQFCVHFVAALC